MENIYELVSENLTELGGLMGTERTHRNWIKHFSGDSAVRKAKRAANEDYSTYRPDAKALKWFKTKEGFRTDDLSFVMYHINKLEIN